MKILAIGDFHGKFPQKLKNKIKKEEVDLILANGDYTGIDGWRKPLRKVFKAREKGEDLWIKDVMTKKAYSNLLKKDYAAGKVVLREINKFKVRTFSVFGNGDWYKVFFNDVGKFYENLIRRLKYIKNINRGKGRFKKLKIAGFGGYLDPDIYFTKKGIKATGCSPEHLKTRKKRRRQWEKKLRQLMKNKPEILLIHYTPYRCFDKMKEKGLPLTGSYVGVSFYNRAIKKYKPALVVCGHMHENPGKCKIGSSLVINPGAAKEGKAAIIEFDEKRGKVKSVEFIK